MYNTVMDDTSGETATAEPDAQAQPAPELEGDDLIPASVQVAWMAGKNTLEQLSRILRPLAVGLMDEMVMVCALCPPHADASGLPSPPIHVIRYRPPQWWRRLGLFKPVFKHVDALLAPSHFSKNVHKQLGLDVPIVHLPHFVPSTETEEVPTSEKTA